MRPAALAGIAQVAAQAGDAAHARAASPSSTTHRGRGVGEELGLARPGPPTSPATAPRPIRIATAVADAAEARGADGFAARARRERTASSRGQTLNCDPRCRANS